MERKEFFYNSFRNKSADYLHDSIRLGKLLENARKKMEKGRMDLAEAYDGIKVFYRLLKAYVEGSYRDIPADKIILIIAAFIYLVSPIDAVFDFLPGGLIDDAAIFLWLMNSLKNEVQKFRKWEQKNTGDQ